MRDLAEWETGQVVDFVDFSIECSCCHMRYRYIYTSGKPRQPCEDYQIRYFPKSHGYLCQKCYLRVGICETEGCNTLAVVHFAKLCRQCYIGEEQKRNINELVMRQQTSIFDTIAEPGVLRAAEQTFDKEEDHNDM